MEVSLEVLEYSQIRGFKFVWEDDFAISITLNRQSVVLSANEAGLRSLARHLLQISQSLVPSNYHFHLDDSNSLEEGSIELIIQKKQF